MISVNEIKGGDLIDIGLFNTCRACGTNRQAITELYPSRKDGAYFLDKFIKFLRCEHDYSIQEYCKKFLDIEWPICPLSGERVGFKVSGKGIILSRFKKGRISKAHCPKFAVACQKLSNQRQGSNNPMFGRTPWNKGKDKRNPTIKAIAENRIGKITSAITRMKQSIAGKNRQIHGHTGKKHSLKTRKLLRIHTAKLWTSGVFSRVSSIHKKIKEFLNRIKFVEQFHEEYQVKYFSMDFAFPIHKVAIECQGSFFHCDPRIYPNGPICAIQRRNFGRDKAKKKICCEQEGWKIIEVWEPEINDGTFKNTLLCKLSELNLLKN